MVENKNLLFLPNLIIGTIVGLVAVLILGVLLYKGIKTRTLE